MAIASAIAGAVAIYYCYGCSYSNHKKETTKQKHTSSIYSGVRWDINAKNGVFWLTLVKNFFKKNLRLFDDEKEAARAYNEAARIHHAEFANSNEISDDEE